MSLSSPEYLLSDKRPGHSRIEVSATMIPTVEFLPMRIHPTKQTLSHNDRYMKTESREYVE